MSNVRVTRFSSREKVQHGAIVPDVHRSNGPLTRHVSLDPRDQVTPMPEAAACPRKRRSGYVEYRDAGQTPVQQVVHETGIPASDIDDSGARSDASALEQMQ